MPEPTNKRVITKAQYRENTYDLGTTFDNIFVSNDNFWSLKDFYDYVNRFVRSPFFEQYGETEPIQNNINVWYDTTTVDL